MTSQYMTSSRTCPLVSRSSSRKACSNVKSAPNSNSRSSALTAAYKPNSKYGFRVVKQVIQVHACAYLIHVARNNRVWVRCMSRLRVQINLLINMHQHPTRGFMHLIKTMCCAHNARTGGCKKWTTCILQP